MEAETITFGLTLLEIKRLQELESTIQIGLKTFNDVGKALLAIQEEGLYRLEYSTFDEYCKAKWGFGYGAYYRHLKAGVVSKTLEDKGLSSPETQSQAFALSILDETQQAEVWETILEHSTPKELTTKDVEIAAKAKYVRDSGYNNIIEAMDSQDIGAQEAYRIVRRAMTMPNDTQNIIKQHGVKDTKSINPDIIASLNNDSLGTIKEDIRVTGGYVDLGSGRQVHITDITNRDLEKAVALKHAIESDQPKFKVVYPNEDLPLDMMDTDNVVAVIIGDKSKLNWLQRQLLKFL